MQTVELVGALDTNKILSDSVAIELEVFTTDTASRETLWFEV